MPDSRQGPTWELDELSHAGQEHLDATYVAGYDQKSPTEVPPFLRTSERLVSMALGDEGGALCHRGFSGPIRRSFGVRRSAWSRSAAARCGRSPMSSASATSRCGSGCGRISSIAVSATTA